MERKTDGKLAKPGEFTQFADHDRRGDSPAQLTDGKNDDQSRDDQPAIRNRVHTPGEEELDAAGDDGGKERFDRERPVDVV